MRKELDQYGAAISKALKLKPKHARTLHQNVRSLSRSLTDERADSFSTDYMSRPENVAAYASYFHPWNLYRMARLFKGLELDIPENGIVLDLGAGPLTVLQAVWLSRPELRERPIQWICIDRAARPLKLGLDMFRAMAGKSPWRIRIEQAPVTRMPRVKADLITAANVLNELTSPSGRSGTSGVERIADSISNRLKPGGRALIIEPGTRLAARTLVALRDELLGHEVQALAPCTHEEECPLPGIGRQGWCHFVFDVEGTPPWLMELTRKAGLLKNQASLSFFYGEKGERRDKGAPLRVVSETFPLPDGKKGRYACGPMGLVLATGGKRKLFSGDLLVKAKVGTARDPKSGALIAELDAPKPAPQKKTAKGRPEKPKRGRR